MAQRSSLVRGLLVGFALLSALAVATFFYLRSIAPRLAGDPMEHAPASSLVVIDVHLKRALEKSPVGEYVHDRIASLPPACGESPLSYVERVSAFLYPGDGGHPDWGLVAPHLPPYGVLIPCLTAILDRDEIAFETFAWTALLRMGVRWGGQVKDSQHQLVSPLHGGFVLGEARTVAAVLDVARGKQPALDAYLSRDFSEAEQARLSKGVSDALVRTVLIPPRSTELRQYWSGRLPGMWPALQEIRVATAGVALEEDLQLQATVLTTEGGAGQIQTRIRDVLERARTLAALVPGTGQIGGDLLQVEGNWVTLDLRIPLTIARLFSRLRSEENPAQLLPPP